jgi:hypothetical protein
VETLTPPPVDEPGHTTRRSVALRVVFVIGAAAFVAFWTWALFFASKESVNRIDDRAWAERGEAICLTATEERLQLTDLRPISSGGPELIRERAAIVDRATDILERMLDDVVAVPPADQKGSEIVPLWEADWRTHIADRRRFTDDLRETGQNLPFYETADGIPLSERIETFAVDNSMPSCAPPRDLTR